jgi:hypothetical protein
MHSVRTPRLLTPHGCDQSFDDDGGTLSSLMEVIPIKFTSMATRLLPDARQAEKGKVRKVILEVPRHGKVEFRCKQFTHKRESRSRI